MLKGDRRHEVTGNPPVIFLQKINTQIVIFWLEEGLRKQSSVLRESPSKALSRQGHRTGGGTLELGDVHSIKGGRSIAERGVASQEQRECEMIDSNC